MYIYMSSEGCIDHSLACLSNEDATVYKPITSWPLHFPERNIQVDLPANLLYSKASELCRPALTLSTCTKAINQPITDNQDSPSWIDFHATALAFQWCLWLVADLPLHDAHPWDTAGENVRPHRSIDGSMSLFRIKASRRLAPYCLYIYWRKPLVLAS